MINKKNWKLSAVMIALLASSSAFAADNGIPSVPPQTQPQTQNNSGSVQLPPIQNTTPSNFYNQGGQGGGSQAPSNGTVYQSGPSQQGQGQAQQTQQSQSQQQANNGQQIMPNQMMPGSAPQSLPPLPNGSTGPSSEDYNAVMQQFFSVTPDQIRNLRKTMDERTKAASELPGPAPKPVTGSISVSLSPGSVPPVIRPFVNTTTSFVVVDNTGQPWPVENFRVGDKNAFEVERLDVSAEGSTFTITSLGMYSRTNLILKLKGLSTPVAIDLISGQKERDERVEVRIQSRGPNATVSSSYMTPGTDSKLLPILDGVPPEGGKQLKIQGADNTTAWMVGRKMIVRTPMKIISPASSSFVSSSDGTNVYVFTPSAQLVGMYHGNLVNVSVLGW